MKHKNIKGFTLIEMLVVITVIAAMSIAIGVSSTNMLGNSQSSDYKETYREIIKNARIYVEIKKLLTSNDSSVDITLNNLIDTGLQDDAILTKDNPALATSATFADSIAKITVGLDAGGKKYVRIQTNACIITTEDSNIASKVYNISDFEWGTC